MVKICYCGPALAYSIQRDQRRQTGILRMSKNINSLQYGRALAALAVLAHHSCLATTAFVERPPHLVEAVLSRGFLGVDFFFVLSGFIIMHAHMNDARTGQAAALYIKKRLRRIYIPYLPVSFCLILLYLAFPSISIGNRDWGVLTSITLFPTEHPPALSVAWTLIHEMMFYTLFLASYFTKRFIIFIFAWVVAIFGAWSIGWTPEFPCPSNFPLATKSRIRCRYGVSLRLPSCFRALVPCIDWCRSGEHRSLFPCL